MEEKMAEIHKHIEQNKERSEESYRRGYELVLDYPARAVTQAAHLIGFTRASLTFFWVIAQFFITFMFIQGDYLLSVIGITLFQLMFIVDLADGKLARYHEKLSTRKIKKPLFYKYLDRVGHYVNDSLLFVFLGYGSIQFGVHYFYVGIAAALFFLFSKTINLNPAWYTSRHEQDDIMGIANTVHIRSKKSTFNQFLFDILRVEHLFSLVFIGIVLNMAHYTLVLYALVYFLEFARKLLSQGRNLMKMDKKYQEELDNEPA
ncbi:MAG TPA: hypothetical protein VJB66_02625 [Candidatus Nanoarchaeia archaeon]|nr:hypothetical protein [Candidatus Nanoarchaeia archaeon]